MIYPSLVSAALLCVWGTTAYMSVCGLMAVFSGHQVVTACLAAGLELGKLLSVIHLHRNWRSLRLTARFFYIMVIACLVTVTAIEAAGFLIQSHQAARAQVNAAKVAIKGLETEEAALRHRIAVIDETLEQLPHGYVTRRINERRASGYEDLQQRLADNLSEQQRLKVDNVLAASSAGPVIALIDMAGLDRSDVVLWFVLLIVCITEPLSIGLAVAASSAWQCRWQKPAKNGQKNRPESETAISAENGQNGKPAVAEPEAITENAADQTLQPAELTQIAEFGQNGRNLPADPAEIGKTIKPAETETAVFENDPDLQCLVKEHALTVNKVAEITGRKKIKTVRAWLDGTSDIPEKAMRELRRWSDKNRRPYLYAVGR